MLPPARQVELGFTPQQGFDGSEQSVIISVKPDRFMTSVYVKPDTFNQFFTLITAAVGW